MNNKQLTFGFIICLVIALVSLFRPVPAPVGAGNPNRFPNGYMDTGYGYYVNGTEVVGSSREVAASTLSASATTTLSDGLELRNSTGLCVDFYATSTATKVKMVASSTAAITGQVTENAGVMLLRYGACTI